MISNSDRDNCGVVGVISAVLIFGLLLSVLVLMNTVYMPQWSKEQESLQSEEIVNKFTQLKYALDIQSLINDTTAMTTTIVLGNKDIPILENQRTFSQLNIFSNTCRMIIDSNTSPSLSYNTDSIVFKASNTYFVDQSYIYEAGNLILNQEDSSVCLGKPSILITEYGRNISIVFMNVTGVSGKTYAGGTGIFPIYTVVENNNQQYTEINNVTDITVITSYPSAWHGAFNSSLVNSGIDFNLVEETDRFILELTDSEGDYYNVFIREVHVSSQISYGLVG